MKTIILILLFVLNFLSLSSQNDTLIGYHENGNLSYLYPKLNNKYHGICKRWYPSGKLWSEGKWINGKQYGKHISYFENGEIQFVSWNKKGAFKKSKSYYSNGNKSLFNYYYSNEGLSKYWYENGNKLMVNKYKKGQPISCSRQILSDGSVSTENEFCYCGNERVFWKDSAYVDSLGNQVNKKFSYSIKEWYEDGTLKSKTMLKKGKEIKKEYDINGILIKEEETSIEKEPVRYTSTKKK